MSYQTVEVELSHGHVRPRAADTLPDKARALLTILEPVQGASDATVASSGAGLRRFLSTPEFPVTPEQFRASMDADLFEP